MVAYFRRMAWVATVALAVFLIACIAEYIYLLVTMASVIFFGIAQSFGR